MVFNCGRCKMPPDAIRKNDFSNNIDHEFSNLNTACPDWPGSVQGAVKVPSRVFAAVYVAGPGSAAPGRDINAELSYNSLYWCAKSRNVASAGEFRFVPFEGWRPVA